MRTTYTTFAAISLTLAACGGGSTALTSNTTPGGTSNGPAVSAEAANTGGGSNASAASAGAQDTSGTSGTAPATRRRRAVLAPVRLDTCTPEAASLVVVGPASARFSSSLGGCGFISSPASNASEVPNEIFFDVFSEIAPIAGSLVCPNGPAHLDFASHTYGTLSTVHSSAENWEVVWAVDDGERVHVGARLTRSCQGVAPTTARTIQSLEVDGGERAVTLYRCAPARPQCPPVP